MRKIKEFKFNWYSKVGVKLIESDRQYEYWAGKKIEHREIVFKFKKSILNWLNKRKNILKLEEVLLYFEKTIMQSAQLGLPIYLDKLKYEFIKGDWEIKEFDYIKFLNMGWYQKFDDNELRSMSELTDEEQRSLIFQRRLPWQLTTSKDDSDYYYIYGRFSAGII